VDTVQRIVPEIPVLLGRDPGRPAHTLVSESSLHTLNRLYAERYVSR
jgi:hypothetical protein